MKQRQKAEGPGHATRNSGIRGAYCVVRDGEGRSRVNDPFLQLQTDVTDKLNSEAYFEFVPVMPGAAADYVV